MGGIWWFANAFCATYCYLPIRPDLACHMLCSLKDMLLVGTEKYKNASTTRQDLFTFFVID